MMYPKSFLEKIGDQLSHYGRRVLFGLLICVLFFPVGVIVGPMIALSFFETSKTYFVANVSVQTSTGEVVPCVIVKQKQYAFIPVLPIMFMCPFFYLPYKTDYILLKNIYAQNYPRDKVNDSLLTAGLIRMERITKAKAKAILSNPQVVGEELTGQAEKARNEFLEKAKPYFETNLFREVYATYHFSVCILNEVQYILFHYSEVNGCPCGICIEEEQVEWIKQDPTFLLGMYFKNSDKLVNELIMLNDGALERLLRLQKKTADEKSIPTATSEVLSQLDQGKKILTKDMIEQTLIKSSSKPKKALGFILCFLAFFATELVIVGIGTGYFVMDIICLPAGIFLWYLAIREIRQGSRIKKNILRGQYKIVQTTCVSVSKEVETDGDGDNTVWYITKFANGESQKDIHPLGGVEGDIFYLVYLPESMKRAALFRGLEYVPSADLVIEEQQDGPCIFPPVTGPNSTAGVT